MTLALVAPNSAQAQEAIVQTNNAVKSLSHPPLADIVFDRPAPKLSISRLKATPSNNDVSTLDFTDAESQTAIQIHYSYATKKFNKQPEKHHELTTVHSLFTTHLT